MKNRFVAMFDADTAPAYGVRPLKSGPRALAVGEPDNERISESEESEDRSIMSGGGRVEDIVEKDVRSTSASRSLSSAM